MMDINKLTAKARIRIRKPPSEVFNAFADAKSMSQFWFTRRDDGLKKGETVSWFIGSGERAISFDVRVKELEHPNKIVIEWENGDDYTQVTWSFEEAKDGNTILTIEESGFTGSQDTIIERAIDSTGGFNQVIVAAKAFIENGVGLNVVADHA
ncbi:MAG: SRPBCC domain-containing protein [Chlorobiales bacterium]|nr:SRPBCC domain-containing protein [Chlorobiales bacterium]